MLVSYTSYTNIKFQQNKNNRIIKIKSLIFFKYYKFDVY